MRRETTQEEMIPKEMIPKEMIPKEMIQKETAPGEMLRGEAMPKEMIQRLADIALEQREYSYSPYSGFRVGAALLTESGEIFTGCNIENASFGATNCAERTAIFKAVSEGKRRLRAICIAGGAGEVTDVCPPCGVCRQVMLEFCGQDFLVILAVDREHYEVHTLGELLPMGFSPSAFTRR